MNKIVSVLFLAVAFFATAAAQNPVSTPPKTDGDVVKISTALIQIDATVTDKDGNTVADLTADDFEVYENDQKQPITNFSFIALQPERAAKAPPVPANSADAINLPPVPTRLRPEQVRRTIALVVDDLGLSFANTKFVKDSLKKFVNEQMQPGDLVAIVSTGKGMGALQQFTSDKRMLYAAIEKIKFNVRRETWSFAPIQPSFKDDLNAGMNNFTGETRATSVLGTEQDRQFDISLNQFREDAFSTGTLGAIKFVINGMKQINGRKAIMLFSEGFSLMQNVSMNPNATALNPNATQNVVNPRIEGAIRELTDAANRSGVIIYAIDPRGLVEPGFTAEDRRVSLRDTPPALQDIDIRVREEKLLDTQHSLKYITEETGGFAVINNNNISKGIQRVLNDQRGYYLLAYQPDEDTFDPEKRRFNKLKIKLKRSDLKIRYRSGFFGVSDSDSLAAKSSQQRMLDALVSPFGAGEISLDLTTLFASDAKDGSFMRSFMHVKGGDLVFVKEDGWHVAKFEVLAVTFGENGAIIDTSNRSGLIKVKAEALKEVQERGLVYSMTTPAKTPGAYQFRIAMRDLNTQKIGAANQFIEVPNLKKQMALSGLLLESSETREKRRKGENNILQSDTQRDRAVRSFRAGTQVMFGASIYNFAAKSGAPNLSTQFRIFRDNQPIYASEESPLTFDGRADTQNVDIGGAFGLGSDMPTGEYILQVIVKDSSKGGKPKIAAQWIDFEVVK